MSGWKLSQEIREKNAPIIESFIEEIERIGKHKEINLTNPGLNPITIVDLLGYYGYSEHENGMETNGWEVDYWLELVHETKKTLHIRGTAMTFELYLYYDG